MQFADAGDATSERLEHVADAPPAGVQRTDQRPIDSPQGPHAGMVL